MKTTSLTYQPDYTLSGILKLLYFLLHELIAYKLKEKRKVYMNPSWIIEFEPWYAMQLTEEKYCCANCAVETCGCVKAVIWHSYRWDHISCVLETHSKVLYQTVNFSVNARWFTDRTLYCCINIMRSDILCSTLTDALFHACVSHLHTLFTIRTLINRISLINR